MTGYPKVTPAEERVICALSPFALTPAELAERSGLHITAVKHVLKRWNARKNPPAYYRDGLVEINL